MFFFTRLDELTEIAATVSLFVRARDVRSIVYAYDDVALPL